MVDVKIAAAAVTVVLVLCGYLYFKYSELKKVTRRKNSLLHKYGVYVEVLPQERESIRERVRGNAATIAALMNAAYYSCDNFEKHKGDIAGQFESLYGSGNLQRLAENITVMANMAENGAFYRLASDYGLTDLELRTCCFIYFGFKWQETCTADSLSENAYSVRCSRIRRKLGMSKEDKIPSFLENYCKHLNTASSSVQ